MAPRLRCATLLAALLPGTIACGGSSRVTPAAAPATHVGTAVCAGCHAGADAAWRRSDHSRAMARATPATVLGAFGDDILAAGGESMRFGREGERYSVRTAGEDGTERSHAVRFTFGFDPLQQYLVEMPRGRYQALGAAWDARPRGEGGHRWFHLQPRHGVRRDVLHWTQPAATWNFMCAECHSTGVRKGYDRDADTYRTTWAAIDVGCEACHGPGSRHAEWARLPQDERTNHPGQGLAVRLNEDPQAVWRLHRGQSTAARSGKPESHAEAETCARCHSRRSQVWSEYVFGQPIEQTHRVALVEEGLYFADGQQNDEVFEYGSFLQSRMYAAGVSCRDCHEPHSGELRAPGNTVCTRCHAPETFDSPAHHFHPRGEQASRCVSCHMPARTYMEIDRRRDHAFRVPRPDETVSLGTPNACTSGGCHEDRPGAWAAAAITARRGAGAAARPSFAPALAAGRSLHLDGVRQLVALADDRGAPAIVRATAVSLLGGFSGPLVASAIERAAADAEPRVRRAAAGLLELLDDTARVRTGAFLVADAIRSVRLEVVTGVAPLASALDAEAGVRLETAIAEFRASQAFNADSASAWVNLANLEVALGRTTDAERALRHALAREPYLVPAVVNLADLLQRRGDEAEAERTLRAAIVRTPGQAALHHSLGLSLVRQRRTPEAMAELARAAALAPDETRFAYVYAVALHDVGDAAAARRVLESAQRRRPAARAVLDALLAYAVDRGDRADARRWAEAIIVSAPGDRAAAESLEQLRQQRLP